MPRLSKGASRISRCRNALFRKKLPTYLRDVKIERDGDIAVVMVRRPEFKNALCMQTVQELKAAFEELDADAKIKGVVFTGYEGALSGADINEFTSLNTREETEGICYKAHPVQKIIANMKKPVVAAVDGPVMGGGAEFCMACHARVVGPNLLFGQPEVNLGIMPGYGATQRLPRLVGVERALELLRTGRTIGAKEACAIGWATGEPVADPVQCGQGSHPGSYRRQGEAGDRESGSCRGSRSDSGCGSRPSFIAY